LAIWIMWEALLNDAADDDVVHGPLNRLAHNGI
jgi:hypothetical protein